MALWSGPGRLTLTAKTRTLSRYVKRAAQCTLCGLCDPIVSAQARFEQSRLVTGLTPDTGRWRDRQDTRGLTRASCLLLSVFSLQKGVCKGDWYFPFVFSCLTALWTAAIEFVLSTFLSTLCRLAPCCPVLPCPSLYRPTFFALLYLVSPDGSTSLCFVEYEIHPAWLCCYRCPLWY